MHHLVADPNSRVRLIAAGYLLSLSEESYDAKAGAVLMAALGDPIPRVREEAHQVFESLGPRGAAILDELQKSDGSGEPQTVTNRMGIRNRSKCSILWPSTPDQRVWRLSGFRLVKLARLNARIDACRACIPCAADSSSFTMDLTYRENPCKAFTPAVYS